MTLTYNVSNINCLKGAFFTLSAYHFVNSLIEEPFAIEGKSSSSSVFHGDTYVYGKLKVPFGTKDKYKAPKGWRDFDTIEEGVDVEIPGAEKCATPTIS